MLKYNVIRREDLHQNTLDVHNQISKYNPANLVTYITPTTVFQDSRVMSREQNSLRKQIKPRRSKREQADQKSLQTCSAIWVM